MIKPREGGGSVRKAGYVSLNPYPAEASDTGLIENARAFLRQLKRRTDHVADPITPP
ncbi:MAG TPA: hypothetical protein VK638_22165 [Edaphobacter sp.]|nr:hypothetical protein [Edaphobacter sp.]